MMEKDGWLVSTYEDYLIAEFDGKYYRIDYTRDGEEITFAGRADWVEVEEKREWVEKSKALKMAHFGGQLRVKVLADSHEIKRAKKADKRMRPWKQYEPFDHRILGVPFGGPIEGRDKEGEAFTKDTDIWLTKGDTVPITYYHGFGPDSPEEVQDPPAIIGRAKYVGADDRGHWFEPRFDSEEPLTQRVMSTKAETLRASSGGISHLVRVKAGGLIDVWPVGELAVFDMNEWRLPANDFAVFEKLSEPQSQQAQAKGAQDAPPDAMDETGTDANRTLQRRALQLLARLSI